MTEPLVLPVRPVLGWHRAGLVHRVLAVSVLPLVLLWAALLAWAPAAGDVVSAVSGLTIGPPAFWCLARVLRPHLGAGLERQLRHAVASTATCLGTAVIVGLAVDTRDGDFLAVFAGLASLGFALTAPWGLAAMVVRAVRTPVPTPRWTPPTEGLTVLPR